MKDDLRPYVWGGGFYFLEVVMKRRVLSMENDPRWEQYKLFSAYAFPCAGLTVPVDITGLYEWM